MPITWRPESSAILPDPGAVLLSCFPSAGLAPTVAGHYILQALKLPRIGTLTSEDFPPLAVIMGGRVNPPVRAYGSKDLILVLSEFPLPPLLINPLATAILGLAAQLKVGRILGLEGVLPHPVDVEEASTAPSEEMVWYAGSGSSDQLPPEYKTAGVRTMGDGVIGGVSGALLVEGLPAKIPVGALLVSATDAGYPDHRAAAKLIEVVDQLLPHVKIDTRPLRTQAELIERALRAAVKSRESAPIGAPGSENLPIYQ
ncbi:MAG TPA: PAC2 family protein [Thermoplasmata archaeon]|nr:PAC2 family protein [Thermoplasmata archaeon]